MRRFLSVLMVMAGSVLGADIQFPGGSLVLPGVSSAGVSFTYAGTLTQNDTISFTQTGNPCLQGRNSYCTNGAGIVVIAGSVPPGGTSVSSFPLVGFFGQFNFGAVALAISGVGVVQVFPANGANGLGSSNPPTSLTLPSTTLAALGFRSFTLSNPTITLVIADTDRTDNSGSLTLTQLTLAAAQLPRGQVGTPYPATRLAASGGNPPLTWSVTSGSLPNGLSLDPQAGGISGTPTVGGAFSFTVRVKDGLGLEASQPFSIIVLSSQPNLTASPAQLSFLYQAREAALPAAQGLSVFSSGSAASFTVAATTTSGGAWLAVSPSAGRTDQSVTVSVPGASTLQPGTYTGTITLNATGTVPASLAVPVTLSVDAARSPQPQLDVTPAEIQATASAGGDLIRRIVTVTNTGSGTLAYTIENTAAFARLDSTSGSLGAGAAASVNLTIDPSGLSPGLYVREIRVRGGSGPERRIALTLTVSRQPRTMLLSQTGLDFVVVEGSSAPPAQELAVLNAGSGRMDWTAETQTLPAGQTWLRVTPGQGSHTAGTVPPALLQVSTDPRGLAVGVYYGSVRVLSPGAANTPQTVTATLHVLRSSEAGGPQLSRTGLVLVGQTGTVNPAAEEIVLYNPGPKALSFSSTRFTVDGADWFAQSPAQGILAAGGTQRVSITGTLSALSPGIRSGALRFAFDDGTVRTVTLSAAIGQPGSGVPVTSAAESGDHQTVPNCRPSRLVSQFTTLEQGFRLTAQQPQSVRVLVKDDCDNLVPDGVVTGYLSDESGQLTFTREGSGVYGVTWMPPAAADNKRIVARALVSQSSGRLGGDTPILSGTVVAAGATQSASPSRVVNGATLGASGQVALGSWVTVFGDRLADGEALSSDPVYPRKLIGTELLLGDQPLPLYYVAKGQVNGLIPSNLEPNTQHQLLIRRGNTQSVGVPVTVSDLQPGIFAMNSQGTGQGAVLIANTGLLAAAPGFIPGLASRRARAGEILEIYSTGLGAVRNAPPDGSPSPGNPLASTLEQPVVKIGGQSATIFFSGLVPGLIGLYQVNAQIPDGVTGDAVPVEITQAGFASNTVTVAVE